MKTMLLRRTLITLFSAGWLLALPATLRAQAPAFPVKPAAATDADIREVERKVLLKQYESAANDLAAAEKAEAAAATPEQKTAAARNILKQRKWMAGIKAKLDQGEPGANPKVAAGALAKPMEEDVAFFEKKYGRKITGVKPKGEYDDPDAFYTAIGQQLGIPEIALKAAAEKYGWKNDDGMSMFTILKGGPVAGAAQGSWDVLFMRSKLNPDTKKPDVHTMEQVMVRVDYDGNIDFPEHGSGKSLRIPVDPGRSMEETAKILVHDVMFGSRAKDKAIKYGDAIIPLIRNETKDFAVLDRADWIADVLGAIKTDSSRKVLLDLYSRTNDLARLVGALGLARQGALPGPSDEDSFLVRMAAVERSPHNEMAILAMGLSRDEKVLPFLVDLLKKGRGARLDAFTCEALANIGSKDAIPVLRDCLKADKFYALPSAFRALIILGDRDAIPLAIARLTPEDKRSGGARWIVVDLRMMTGEKFGFDQAGWQQWWDSAKGSWQIPEKFRTAWDYDTTAQNADDTKVLPKPIVIGDSGYTLSRLSVRSGQCKLVFTGKVSAGIGMPESEPLLMFEGDGNGGMMEPRGHSFSHQYDDFEYVTIYKKLPADATKAKVVFFYKNKAGEEVKFTTPEIVLK